MLNLYMVRVLRSQRKRWLSNVKRVSKPGPPNPRLEPMRIAYAVGYWKQGPPRGALKAIRTAERLGFESVWTAEAYGSDAFTPLAWWGSQTRRIKLGTGIAQLSARTPTAAAMAALTLDHLSGGRVILGIGASGPQVVEGWYGQPYPKPLARTREYIDIVRQVLARETPVESTGEHYRLPYIGPDASGLGKPLKSTVHPLRADLPIYLAAEGPKNVALAAEIADGWLPFLFSPKANADAVASLEAGFALRAPERSPARISRLRCRWRSSRIPTWRRPRTWCGPSSRSTSEAWARKARTTTAT